MKQHMTPNMNCLAILEEDILTASFQNADEGMGDSVNYFDLL